MKGRKPGLTRPVLCFCIAQFLGLQLGLAQTAQPTEVLPLLTHVAQVRALSSPEAQRGYPVRIEGVLVYYDHKLGNDFVIQDSTGSIYVREVTNPQPGLKIGDLLELQGISASGEYAPMVVRAQLKLLGKGQIPTPRSVSYDDLATGAEDGQWVEVHAIVRSAAVERLADRNDHEYLMLKLACGGGQFTARVLDFDGGRIDRLPDSEVQVSGVCIPIFNRKRQLVNVSLVVPGMHGLRITKEAPEHPFDQPAVPINTLLQFDPQRLRGHRVKVAGQVTLQRPGDSLFIKDATQGLSVRTRQHTPVKIGARVEALGFPVLGGYTPVLEDAIFLTTGMGAPLEPIPLSVHTASEGNYDSDLIRLEATYTDCVRRADDLILVLQEREFVFNAHLDLPAKDTALESIQKGSRVQLTGICQVQLGNQRWPQSFRLLLRSPADVVVVRAPPWWTMKRTRWILGIVTVCLCGVVGGVVRHSKQKVREQIRVRRETEALFSAVNQERSRLAAELHDSLEQTLTGILLQAEAAAEMVATAPAAARHHLDRLRKLVHQGQDEVRRSVWDLRSQMLDDSDLGGALSALGKQLCDGNKIQFSVETSGQARRLPERIENNLLRIGQEAIANAFRHAEARIIRVELQFQSDLVRLMVCDDGTGFIRNPSATSCLGHFGLMGMRERAKKLGGTISIQSECGIGTTVTVEVPLAGADKLI